MAKSGLKKWFSEKWVDISAPKKGGGYKECGRKSASGSNRKYPKCVPAAKASRMTESEKRSAVARKEQPVILVLNQLTSRRLLSDTTVV
jgi:hypothetical protein